MNMQHKGTSFFCWLFSRGGCPRLGSKATHAPPPIHTQHTNHWAPRTRKQHQQEHRLQRPTAPTGHTGTHKGTTRCKHGSNHQMRRTPSEPSANTPPPSTGCPRTPQGWGLRPHAGRCPPRGWQQGRDQPTTHGTVHVVQRCEILVRGGRRVGQEGVCDRGTQERQQTGGGATQTHRTREPHQEGQGRAQQTRRRGTARKERQPEQWEQGTRMEGMGERAHPVATGCQGKAGYGRPVDRGAWTAKTVKRPRQQPAHPQYANYWAPLARKRHTMPHSAHTNYWAPRTRKRHQQEHRPQRPTESSNPTQHAKGRTGDCPGPRKGISTRRNVTQGAWEPPGPPVALPRAPYPPSRFPKVFAPGCQDSNRPPPLAARIVIRVPTMVSQPLHYPQTYRI